ncbi:hypothetical protein HYW46_00900 [Candidatus Daviesbacteria bacterium]|nr:hypothetical protein [Candidatus Daviesbacteria bacterium]
MKYFRSTKVQILIIILATFLAYLNIFQNGFVVDDEDFIVNWKEKQEITNVPLMLKGNNPPKFGGIYRPIRGVLYTFYDQIFGANPFGYHLHSILVHLGVTVLVYFITRQLIQGLGSRGWGLGLEVKTKKNSTIPYTLPQRGKLRLYPIPFISALLFGLHPIHTDRGLFYACSAPSLFN